MRPGPSPSVFFVVFAQIAMYVALPLACCVSGAERITDICAHHMESGDHCPMHASPHHKGGDPDASAFRRCRADEPMLTWLDVPVAPLERPRPLHLTLDWAPMTASPVVCQGLLGGDPPSPPPRA